jgi:predicted dehydrogenase
VTSESTSTQECRYRAAIIGCGRMAHGHARAYLDDPRTELVACADIFESAATGFATEFGISNWYLDLREMLEKEKPDIVSICTHHPLHAPMTIETARIAAPKAILCEKPIAMNLAEADEMIATCRAQGTILIVGHQRRFDRQYMAARQAIVDGKIGDVISVEAFGHPRSSLLVDSTHTVDLVRFFLGDPKGAWVLGQIDAGEHREAWGQQIEDTAVGLIGFEGGGHLLLGAGSIGGNSPESRISISPQPVEGATYHRIVVQGTAGRMVVDGDRPLGDEPMVHIHRGAEVEVIYTAADHHSIPGFSAVSQEVSALIDCLEQPGLVHPLEAQSARDTLEILIGIYESSRRRAAVRLPLDVGDNPLLTMLAQGVV